MLASFLEQINDLLKIFQGFRAKNLTYCGKIDFMPRMWNFIRHFTKLGIVVSVIGAGIIGFFLSQPIHEAVDFWRLFHLSWGLMFLSAGSLSLNQVQEWKKDAKMARTQHRPIPAGQIKPTTALAISLTCLVVGWIPLFQLNLFVGFLGVMSVVLYNGFYTLRWKPKMKWGAIPGALPGALPLLIGFAVNDVRIWSPTMIYAFLVMFLWQMPHFWTLALKYTKDYRDGDFPVLNVVDGRLKTQVFIGWFLIAYLFVVALGIATLSKTWIFSLMVIPFTVKLAWDYLKFMKSQDYDFEKNFFIGVNMSLVPYLLAPIADAYFYTYL